MENFSNVADVDSIINRLVQKPINFVALDFDNTFISVHTDNREYPMDYLENKVRPFFRIFVPRALEAGICIGIVTFSRRTDMISELLYRIFPEVHHKIVIRGDDGRWQYGGISGCKGGKQRHMASAAAYLRKLNNVSITRQSTLLIDDDVENVCYALRENVCAILCDMDGQLMVKQLIQGF